MFRKRTCIAFSIVLLFLFANLLPTFASEIGIIPILEEIDAPSDFNFSVSNTCLGHAYFMQATADESGCFAVYSYHVNPDDFSDVDLKKVYIDVYRSDGSFWCELSFVTPLAFGVELDGNHVNVYFYSSLMVYDLVSGELVFYAIPEDVASESGLMKQLRASQFTAGNWEYSCKKGYNGYIQLSRSNGEQEQILIKMPGSDVFVTKTVIPGAAYGFAMTAVIIWFGKKKKK